MECYYERKKLISAFNSKKSSFKNFVDKQGVWICDKSEGVHKKEIPIRKPSKLVNFGRKDFYGQEKIEELTSEETISPKKTIRFEDFLSEFIENPITEIFKKIIKRKALDLSQEEKQLIIFYCYIQHVRTPKYKKDTTDFLSTSSYQTILNSIPSNFKKVIEPKLEKRFSPNNHTTLCILSESLNAFLLETKIQEKLIHLLVGNNTSQFILPDSGLIWALITESKEEVCYIPLSPTICIFFSKSSNESLRYHSSETLKELAWIEAAKELYSNNKKILEELYNKMKEKKIITLKDELKK